MKSNTFTVYDINNISYIKVVTDVVAATDDNPAYTHRYIKIKLKSDDKPLIINEEDELFEYHLKNANALKEQLVASWKKQETLEGADGPN